MSANTGFDLTVGDKKPVKFGLGWPVIFIFRGDNLSRFVAPTFSLSSLCFVSRVALCYIFDFILPIS